MSHLFLLFLSAFAVTSTTAASPSEGALDALARSGITLVEEARFSDELVLDLARGLERLPERHRSTPNETLLIELHDEPSDFGLGDGSKDRPEWSEGFGRFHLYAYAEPPDPRANHRLERLPEKTRESLWRQRAIVHALVRRQDALTRFSDSPEWRRIVGWLAPFDRPLTFATRPLIDYPWAFSRYRGLDSPALDFATFAEEALVPAESFDSTALPADDRVRCQEFTKSRALSRFLDDPETTRNLAPKDCKTFDAWARFDEFSHLEVLFSEPSGGKAQTLFGHVALRLVYERATWVQGPGSQTIVELAALTGPGEGPLEYLAKGLGGGFKAVFQTTSLAALLKQNLETEERSISRYRVELSVDESRRALERVWELERRGYVDYYFFSENCARMLVFLLDVVLAPDRHIESSGRFIAFPTSSLDALANVTAIDERTGDTRPLLTRLEPGFVSSLEHALVAEKERKHALETLLPSLTRPQSKRWRTLHRELESSNGSRRKAAFETLDALVDDTLAEDVSTVPIVTTYVGASARIERLALDRLDKERMGIDLRRLRLPEGTHIPSTDEMLFARQLSYERERPNIRDRTRLEEALALEGLLRTSPRREPTEQEARVIEDAERQRALFTRVLESWGRLLDLTGTTPDTVTPLSPENAPPPVSGEDTRFRDRSGDGRVTLGLGVARTETGAWKGALTWRTSLLADTLGEARAHGVGALGELRLLDGKTTWGVGLGWPEHLRTDVTLIGFRSLLRAPKPVRTPVLGTLGWGWDVGARMRTLQTARFRGTFAVEIIAPLFLSDSGESQTLLALGIEPELRAHWLPNAGAIGPRIRLHHRTHLGGAYPNALSIILTHEPRWTLLGDTTNGRFWQSMEAEASLTRLFFERIVLGMKVEVSVDEDPEFRHIYGHAGLLAEW